MQRVANIFRKLCPLAMKCQVHESRLISINEDEGKSTRAGISEVDQINRGQPRSNQAFGSKPLAYEQSTTYGNFDRDRRISTSVYRSGTSERLHRTTSKVVGFGGGHKIGHRVGVERRPPRGQPAQVWVQEFFR